MRMSICLLAGHIPKAVRVKIGLMSEHCKPKRHLCIFNLVKEAICRFCQEEKSCKEKLEAGQQHFFIL